MINATGTPDYPLPAVVNQVQESLGIEKCATLEIRSGGAGWPQGLDIARFYLEQGSHKTALVIGSESMSPVLAPTSSSARRRTRSGHATGCPCTCSATAPRRRCSRRPSRRAA